MTPQSRQKRRSDRLWLTVPVQVEGADSQGQAFECEGRVINLNRYGGRVQIPRHLARNQRIRLKSPDARHQADFHVVDIIASAGSPEVEYGAECLDHSKNFWQIEFPPPANAESEVSRVLLECNKCNTMALLPLTLSEVQAVRSMGWVGKSCAACAGISLWKYAQVGKSQSDPESHSKNSSHEPSSWISSVAETSSRSHRRVYVMMPLGIRDAHGNEEITQTENISKCGFCFASEKLYTLGEGITVTFENAPDALTHTTVLPAQIVREQPILGAHRKLYGATYC
jgi:hypothetical protein